MSSMEVKLGQSSAVAPTAMVGFVFTMHARDAEGTALKAEIWRGSIVPRPIMAMFKGVWEDMDGFPIPGKEIWGISE